MELKTQTHYNRDSDGWSAVTRYCAARITEGRQVTVRTYKCSSKLVTMVTSSVVRDGVESFRIGSADCGDYRKTWATAPMCRVTERAVKEQHETMLRKIDEFAADVHNHYLKQKAESSLC